MKFFSGFISKNSNLKNVYPLLIGFNVFILLIGLLSNSILASKFGTSLIKDNLELSLSISRNVVISLGIGSLGGSTLYIISRSQDWSSREISEYLSSIFLLQFLYSLLIFILFMIFQNKIISFLAPNISINNFETIKNFLYCTSFIILLQPIIDILNASTTGLQIYGLNILGTAIQKIFILLGVVFVSIQNPIIYPLSVVVGMLVSILFLIAIISKKGLHLRSWSLLHIDDIKDTLRISLPWIIISPFVNIVNWIVAPILFNLGPGNYSIYLYAYSVYTLCITVIITPFSDTIGPALSKKIFYEDENTKKVFLIKSFRLSYFIGIFFSSILIAMSKPIIGFLFLRGSLMIDSAISIAHVLIILSISLGFQSTTIYLSRFFQSQISMSNYIMTQLVAPLIMLVFVYFFQKNISLINLAIVITFSSIVTGLLSWIRGNTLMKAKLFNIDFKLLLWSIFCLLSSSIYSIYFINISTIPIESFYKLIFISPLFILCFLLSAKLLKLREGDIFMTFVIQKLKSFSTYFNKV